MQKELNESAERKEKKNGKILNFPPITLTSLSLEETETCVLTADRRMKRFC